MSSVGMSYSSMSKDPKLSKYTRVGGLHRAVLDRRSGSRNSMHSRNYLSRHPFHKPIKNQSQSTRENTTKKPKPE